MSLLTRRSTYTALGACFFIAGVVLMFVVLYHEPMRRGPGPIITAVLLIGALACWVASARMRNPGSGEA
jgi:multisubunit Na+/H+ antiporter MnhB subunit